MQETLNFNDLRVKAGLSIQEAAQILDLGLRTIYRYDNGEVIPQKSVIITLETYLQKKEGNKSSIPQFTFIDLFAGIGGLRKGFEPFGGKCIFTSEWNEYAQKTYKANYDCDHDVLGDITKIELETIPSHDFLLAGFPCQPFSIAGVSKKNSLNRPHGFCCETQGNLFFEVAKIINYHKPKAFLLENVKNLVNHDKGRTFKIIHQTLTEELGYHIQWKVIDAKSWVPQHRERIFIVGFKEPNNFNFDDFYIPNPLTGPKLKSILHPEDGSELIEKAFTDGKDAKVLSKYTLSDKLWDYLQAYAKKHKEKGNGFGFGLVGPEDVSRTLSARYYKDGSEILINQINKNPRRLTPRECSRLMGFDKPAESKFIIPVSNTQAYKQFGNAVAVPVVQSIAEFLTPYLISKEYNKLLNSEKVLQEVG